MQDPAGEGLPFSAPEGDIGGALGAIQRMLRAASGGRPPFPPTLLYNEGWLLRLILDWFAGRDVGGHPLSFATGARWFSEALLPSAFLARYRGDELAESWTHADGVVGHFVIGEGGKADLRLAPEAGQLLVLEAKLFSGLLLVTLALSSLAFAAFGLILASIPSRSVGNIMMPSTLIRWPLLFISGTFVPLAEMASWARPLAYLAPLTYSQDLVNYTLLGVSHLSPWLDLGLLPLLFLLFLLPAAWLHHRSRALGY
jgi:hypothetical protein